MEKELSGPATSYLARLSSASHVRIRAGLMKTHSRWMNTPESDWRSCLREAYDVFASELIKNADSDALFTEIIPQLVSDEAIRNEWVRWFQGMSEPDSIHTDLYGSYWVDRDKIRLIQRAVESCTIAWRAEHLLLHGETDPRIDSPKTTAEIITWRNELLTDYKQRTGVTTNAAIYNAKNSGVHKPDFYRWLTGKLSVGSATARNLESFLRSGDHPHPRNFRD